MSSQSCQALQPQRCIYTEADMRHFQCSSAKRDLLGFVSALGKGCITNTLQPSYDPRHPLRGLSPGMAALHGALVGMKAKWIFELPPDERVHARFGNPRFREWHKRLETRSTAIIKAIMACHLTHLAGLQQDASMRARSDTWVVHFESRILEECSAIGFQAATEDTSSDEKYSFSTPQEINIIAELRSHLHQSFGHPIRLDYGTGHESCFFIFLLCLVKLGLFGYANDKLQTSSPTNPPPNILAPVALSILTQYLEVCRGLQTHYMLEPAGSHGVWGLDDYHCIPFYIGACQLQQPLQCHKEEFRRSVGESTPASIHVDELLQSEAADIYMYFGCIRHIKSLKKGVPFFESSPMLNDVSQLKDWGKVSAGLLRLYEGEVLEQLPVVQHFLFGDLFKASWTPSEVPQQAPTRVFINGPGGNECIAPWASQRLSTSNIKDTTTRHGPSTNS